MLKWLSIKHTECLNPQHYNWCGTTLGAQEQYTSLWPKISDNFFVWWEPVQPQNCSPEHPSDCICCCAEGQEDGVEGEGGGEEEEEDGEDDRSKEELLNWAISTVNSVSQRIVLFAWDEKYLLIILSNSGDMHLSTYKESPESCKTGGLTGGKPAKTCKSYLPESLSQGVRRFEMFEFLSEKINFAALGGSKSSSFEPDTSHP